MKPNGSAESIALTTHVAELLVAVVNRAAAAGVLDAEADQVLGPLLLRMLTPEVELTSIVAEELDRALQV
jgi:hypothetical protein